jgi:hypothetical protein
VVAGPLINLLAACLFAVLFTAPAAAQEPDSASQPIEEEDGRRSFSKLFPGITESQRKAIFTEEGLIRALGKNQALELLPSPDSGIDLAGPILAKNHPYHTESLLVVPYSEKIFNKLDAYNALGNIRGLKGRLYRSHSRSAEVPLFEDATRVESAKRNRAIPDPEPAGELPFTETVHIRLKDANFGNTYYRSYMYQSLYGINYTLTNYKNFNYFIFTIMKEERFSAALYMEPLIEGMLVYSTAGADASDFIASKVDVPTTVAKRLAVFVGWLRDGLKALK